MVTSPPFFYAFLLSTMEDPTYFLLFGIAAQICGGETIRGFDSSECVFTEDIFVGAKSGLDWNYNSLASWDDLCFQGQLQSPVDLPRSSKLFFSIKGCRGVQFDKQSYGVKVF